MIPNNSFVADNLGQIQLQQLTPEQIKYQYFTSQIGFLAQQIANLGPTNPSLSAELLRTYLELNKLLINSDLKP